MGTVSRARWVRPSALRATPRRGMFLSNNVCNTNADLVGTCEVPSAAGGCAVCNAGNFQSERTCAECGESCSTCLNGESCSTCSAEHFMTATGDCKAKTDIGGCAGKIDSALECTKCVDGFFLDLPEFSESGEHARHAMRRSACRASTKTSCQMLGVSRTRPFLTAQRQRTRSSQDGHRGLLSLGTSARCWSSGRGLCRRVRAPGGRPAAEAASCAPGLCGECEEASHGADTVVKDVTTTISGSSTRRALKSPTRVSSSSPTTTGPSAATSQTHEPTGVWQTSNHASRRTWSATVPHLTQRDAGRRRVRRERRVCGVPDKQRGGRVRRRRVHRERGLRRGGYGGGFL